MRADAPRDSVAAMRRLRFALLGLVALLALGAAALVALPADRLARMAAERIEAETGRAVAVDGPVRATLWPGLGVTAEGIRVANAPWSSQGPMVVAERMAATLDAGALLRGRLRLAELRLDGAALTLEHSAAGEGNWQVASTGGGGAAASDAGGDGAPGPGDAPFDRIVLSGAEVAWIDHAAARTLRLRAVDLDLSLGADAAVLDVSALAGRQAVRLAGRVAAPDALLGGALSEVSLSLASGGSAVTLDGRAGLDPPAFDGTVDARSDDRLAVLAALGLSPFDPPEGFGRDRLAVTAAVTLAPDGGLHLRGLDAALDDNRLSGGLDLVPGPDRPRLTATLDAPALDLGGLGGGEGARPAPADPGEGADVAAGAALDLSPLFALDADLRLASGPVELADLRLDRVAASLALERGRAVLTLDDVRLYEGRLSGALIANARGGQSARADLTLADVAMGPLLEAVAGVDRLSGRGGMRLDLLGEGRTADAMIGSARGRVALDLGEAAWEGVDLRAMIRGRDPRAVGEGRTTVLAGATAAADVADGVATLTAMRLAAPELAVAGTGTIDLRARTLDLVLAPETSGTPLRVTVRGPWSDPDVRPDLDRFAREAAAAERSRLETRAREEAARLAEEARARLARELGTDPEALSLPGGIEDAVRGRIENELIELLRGD